MKKIFLILSILISICLSGIQAAVSFQASAPETVAMGEAFRLVYTLNASNAKDLRMPEMPSFDILAGPFESRSQSVQVVNGQVNTTVSLSYTYTLSAKKTGTFTIPSASIFVENQRYNSNTVKITVLPADKAQQQRGSKAGTGSNMNQKLSDENVFVRAIASKTKLYEQEYLLITYKLYSLVDVVGFTNNVNLPNFNGFMKQDIELPKTPQMKLENYNGKNYMTNVLFQALLYPQQSGTITIDKADFEAIVRITTRAQVRSIFDDFFDTYQDVKKTLVVPSLKITVDKLPGNKPADFSGAVGSFSFKSDISESTVSVNDPVTLRFTISGNGNMKLIKNPEVEFPTDFETYDPTVNNNFKNTTSGVTGSKTIEYLLVPRSEGDFVIPSYKFSYFDVNSKSYRSVSSPEYKIHVNKGNGKNNSTAMISNFANQEQLKVLGKDIRYIETERFKVREKGAFFFGSVGFWLCLILPLLLAVAVFIFYRKQLKENADILAAKNKKANKVAINRLKTANKYLVENRKEEFYDEVLRALWGYLSDKLAIPVSALSKDNIEGKLKRHGVENEDITEFMQVLSVCEYARYAPATDDHAMDNLYQRTIAVISKFQQVIR
ncbi:MAG: BatD family protein [Prevotellaceae bacterium]|jgi:uncharacterized protein YaiE (UPF0345 family)|nr:BatD family protein [Prevotellaceae bacterium]